MSEYQYYEFQALDQPLDERAQRALRAISSRATITPTSFTNTYSWSDLRGDPAKMLAQWFDAALHVTNWGTRWLGLRLPSSVLSQGAVRRYELEIFSASEHADHLCLHFNLQPDDGGVNWLDGEALLGPLLPLREALAAGDHRCLYLAWLADLPFDVLDDGDDEPPVPSGLGQLDAAHKAFVALFDVDPDLLAVAARASAPLTATDATRDEARAWLASVDHDQQQDWLLQVIEGDGSRVRWELRQRLRDHLAATVRATPPPRTVGELLEQAEAHAVARRNREAAERATLLRQQAAQRDADRQRRLDAIVGQERELWQQIEELVATCKPKAYDQAISLITDLRALAERTGDRAAWEARSSALRAEHYGKRAFVRRLDKVGEAADDGPTRRRSPPHR